MGTVENIRWFKENFGAEIQAGVKGTPFTLDMLTAIAVQETGFVWGRLRTKGLSRDRILELSVGDTISARSSTFPRNKAELLAVARGPEMFKIARDALVDLGHILPDFAAQAAKPDKFCHGFGIFQYDIQFFRTEPDYFLERRWRRFDQTLGKAIEELKDKMKPAKVPGKTSLTDMEMAQVAIAYNSGKFIPAKGLKQGHQEKPSGRFYGENFMDFLKLSKSVPVDTSAGAPTPAPPAGAGASGLTPGPHRVRTAGDPLMLRNAPRKEKETVIGKLNNGDPVTVVSATLVGEFAEVEAVADGQRKRGFAGARFLIPS